MKTLIAYAAAKILSSYTGHGWNPNKEEVTGAITKCTLNVGNQLPGFPSNIIVDYCSCGVAVLIGKDLKVLKPNDLADEKAACALPLTQYQASHR